MDLDIGFLIICCLAFLPVHFKDMHPRAGSRHRQFHGVIDELHGNTGILAGICRVIEQHLATDGLSDGLSISIGSDEDMDALLAFLQGEMNGG